MVQRGSRHLAGMPPQHQEFNDACFICLRDLTIYSVLSLSVSEMGCCSKYIHASCYDQMKNMRGQCDQCHGQLIESVLTPLYVGFQQRRDDYPYLDPEPRRHLASTALENYRSGAEKYREFPNVSSVFD